MKPPDVNARDMDKAALCGEPSYIWRAGQERRLRMILDAAGKHIRGNVLDNGCGVGMFVQHLAPYAGKMIGLEFDFARLREARRRHAHLLSAASEYLPFPDQSFDVILSHEVLEHVRDDRASVSEMVRTLKPGGRMLIFVPNRGYPFETHGIYWRGNYRFGNIPLVNYLPRVWRNRLAPHVRVYSASDVERLVAHLPVEVIHRRIIFGAYDNIIARSPALGRALRALLQAMERTPLQTFGLSHFWVLERT